MTITPELLLPKLDCVLLTKGIFNCMIFLKLLTSSFMQPMAALLATYDMPGTIHACRRHCAGRIPSPQGIHSANLQPTVGELTFLGCLKSLDIPVNCFRQKISLLYGCGVRLDFWLYAEWTYTVVFTPSLIPSPEGVTISLTMDLFVIFRRRLISLWLRSLLFTLEPS